jgi:hypothetical protein
MRPTRTLRIWIAALMLGALGFSQASVSLAACSMERGAIGEVLAEKTAAPCDCGAALTEFGPLYANRCVAHCTSDLQLTGAASAIASGTTYGPMLVLPRAAAPRWTDAPPPMGVPKRIQLHSFLV